MAAGVPRRRRPRVSGSGQAEARREPGGGTGAQDRPANSGDRFFKTCLAASRRSADAASAGPNCAIYEQIEKETEREKAMTVLHMCDAADVSRAGFYRRHNQPASKDRDIDLRDEIQKI